MLRPTVLGLCVVCLAVAASPAAATTMTVNDGGDVSGASFCTLRDAIIAANSGVVTGGCPAGTNDDTIVLAVPTVTLSQARSGADTAQKGDLDVTRTVTIQGAAGGTTIDAAHLDRVLDVMFGAQVSLQNLTLTGGLSQASGGAGSDGEDGGGIRNAGTLTLDHVTVSGNATSPGATGASGTAGGLGGHGGRGGGIASTGPLTIADSVVSGNTTGVGGAGGLGVGAAGTSGSHAGVEGDGGSAKSGGDGGGIYSAGASTVTDSTISGNHTGAGGQGGSGHGGVGFLLNTGQPGGNGGAGQGGPGGFGGSGGGIAVEGGTLTLSGSLVWGNVAGNGGAGGAGVGGSGGNGEIAGVGSGAGGNGGRGAGDSGGFGGAGGGLYTTHVAGTTTLTATSDTVTANATGQGATGGTGTGGVGGTSTTTGGNGGNGLGGIGGDGGSGAGAEQNVLGGTFDPLTLVADTLTQNAAAAGGNGATAAAGGGGNGSTVGNSGSSTAGAAGAHGAGGGVDVAAVTDSIIASNTPDQCSNLGSGSTNVVSPDASCPGIVADPLLAPLADNGGPTLTMRLLAGSPAIDLVATVNGGCPTTDQRGIARPQGPACDAGAYERAAPGATTGAASATTTTANLTSTVQPNKQQTTVRFAWGTGTGADQVTADQTVAPGSTGVEVDAPLAGLAPATTYHYRVVATNPDGTTTGSDQTFTTGAEPPGTGTGTGGTGSTGTTPGRPALARLTLTPSSFRPVTKTHRTHRGTAISYTDSQAAKTTFTVDRRLPGVRKGRRCVAPPKRVTSGSHPKRCTRYRRLRGSFAHHDSAGKTRLRWTGALRGKPLAPGGYRLDARPVLGTTAGPVVRRAFMIKR